MQQENRISSETAAVKWADGLRDKRKLSQENIRSHIQQPAIPIAMRNRTGSIHEGGGQDRDEQDDRHQDAMALSLRRDISCDPPMMIHPQAFVVRPSSDAADVLFSGRFRW
jgi:hypothetical protein